MPSNDGSKIIAFENNQIQIQKHDFVIEQFMQPSLSYPMIQAIIASAEILRSPGAADEKSSNCRRQFRQGQRLAEILTENKEVNTSEIWHSHCISSMA
jgi:hypothetical protein